MKTRTLVFLVTGIILLSTVWSWATSKNEIAPSPLVLEKVFQLSIKDGALTSGENIFKATEGDAVTFIVASDEVDELHLHGYDLALKLTKDVPAELSFTANLSGRFELELHHSEAPIGALEVFPK